MNNDDMYVVKLTFDEYRNFAQWMTEDVGGGQRRYQSPPGPLNGEIETKLQNYPAKVYEYCDPGQPPRDFAKGPNGDNVNSHPDSAAPKRTNISLPRTICENNDGEIDLEYLKGYVEDIRNAASVEDAAWSLLGMYFLSRCR